MHLKTEVNINEYREDTLNRTIEAFVLSLMDLGNIPKQNKKIYYVPFALNIYLIYSQ